MKPFHVIPGLGLYYPRYERSHRAAEQAVEFIDRHGDDAFGAIESCHITASGFVVSPARQKTLLMHHRKLDIWFQPGGHCDGNRDVHAVAEREIREETGLEEVELVRENIYDIDVHEIPAPGNHHTHIDIRFLFEADPSKPLRKNHESKELRWVTMEELHDLTDNPSVLIVANTMSPTYSSGPRMR